MEHRRSVYNQLHDAPTPQRSCDMCNTRRMAESDNNIHDDLDDEFLGSSDIKPSPSITMIKVEDLFGRYTYTIETPESEQYGSRLVLLHGDNGSGKTTILKLVWHLLSTAETTGHKSALARTPFSRLAVYFSDGRSVQVVKTGGLRGAFDIVTASSGKPHGRASFQVSPELDVGPTPSYGRNAAEQRFLNRTRNVESPAGLDVRNAMNFIRALNVEPALLADDRRLRSDEADAERERTSSSSTYPAVGRESRPQPSDELSLSLRSLNSWIRTLAIEAGGMGSEHEATIYETVLESLGQSAPQDEPASGVRATLRQVGESTPAFSSKGLMPEFNSKHLEQLLDAVPQENHGIAVSVLEPYLQSLQARMAALAEAELVVSRMVTHSNRFLKDKSISFQLSTGFRISTGEPDASNLRPSDLSSGERQVLLLLCNTLLKRRKGALFLIDEPELSLGMAWQRQIIDALMDCTEGTSVQFIIATHSVAIVSSNADSLVDLV